MIFVYSENTEKAERLKKTISRYSLFFDFTDRPLKGVHLIFSGRLDPRKGIVHVPDPVPLKTFSSALIESEVLDLNVKIPYCIREDLFNLIEERAKEGLYIGTDMEGCRWNEKMAIVPSSLKFEKVGRDVLKISPKDLEERRILRLLGKGLIDEEEAIWMIAGKRFLEGSSLAMVYDMGFSIWKGGMRLKIDDETFKIEKRINVIPRTAFIEFDDLKIDLKIERSFTIPRTFRIGKIRDFTCGFGMIFLWNEKGIEAIDTEEGFSIWKIPMETVGVDEVLDKLAILSRRYVHIVDPMSGNELIRMEIDGKYNQIVGCGEKLALGSFDSVRIYEFSDGLKLIGEDIGGIIGCWMKDMLISRDDFIKVGDRGTLFPGGRVWDFEAVDEKLAVSLGNEILLFSRNFDLLDRFVFDETADEMASTGSDLFVLLKDGRLVRFDTGSGLRMKGEIERDVKLVRSCEGLYVLKDEIILELIPQKF